MSIVYCEYCDESIDTDSPVEHFDEDGKCFEGLENMETTEKDSIHVDLAVDVTLAETDGIKRTMEYCTCEKPERWQGDNYCRKCGGLITEDGGGIANCLVCGRPF